MLECFTAVISFGEKPILFFALSLSVSPFLKKRQILKICLLTSQITIWQCPRVFSVITSLFTSIMQYFLCSWIEVQPHNHWGTGRTYFCVYQSRVTAPCTGWAGAEASFCWDGWARPGVAIAGAEILCLSALCLILRKEGLWTDWWVAHAGRWKWIPKFNWETDNVGFAEGPLWSLKLKCLLSTGCLYFFPSLLTSDVPAFPAAHCPEEQWPCVASWAHLNCRVTALSSKTSIFLHWQLLLDWWPQLLLKLLFKTWAVFLLCSSIGAAPEKVTVMETMAYSFLSLLPIAS